MSVDVAARIEAHLDGDATEPIRALLRAAATALTAEHARADALTEAIRRHRDAHFPPDEDYHGDEPVADCFVEAELWSVLAVPAEQP